MKKIATLVCMVISLFFAKAVYAEDYMGRDFPSAAVLERACAADLSTESGGQAKIVRYLGKIQSNAEYQVNFAITGPQGGGIVAWTLYKLDTNLWLIKSIGGLHNLSVLQK